MNVFLIGLLGSLTGGLILMTTVYSVYLYELSQRRKAIAAAKQDINGILNDLQGLLKHPAKGAGKYN